MITCAGGKGALADVLREGFEGLAIESEAIKRTFLAYDSRLSTEELGHITADYTDSSA